MEIILGIIAAWILGKVLEAGLGAREGAQDGQETKEYYHKGPGPTRVEGGTVRAAGTLPERSAGEGALVAVPPDPDAARQALSLCQFFAIEPAGPTPANVDALPGDIAFTIFDRESTRGGTRPGKERTVLSSAFARRAQTEIHSWFISDYETGMAGVPATVSFVGERSFTWRTSTGAIPTRARNRIWAMRGDAGFSMAAWVRQVLEAMGRPAPRWILANPLSGPNGPMVRFDQAMTTKARLWRDVFAPMLTGLVRELVAVIAGYLRGGPAGAVSGLITESARIVRDAYRTGTISGNLAVLTGELAVKLQEAGILDAIRSDFDAELGRVRQIIDITRAESRVIRDRFESFREEVERATSAAKLLEITLGVTSPSEQRLRIERQKATQLVKQTIAGQDGALCALASSVAGKKGVPWRLRKVTLYE